MFEDELASKIFEDSISDEGDSYYDEIRERNNYYQELISKNKEIVPHALNTVAFIPIASPCILEKEILNSDKHLSTLITKYNITREFIFLLLKNYKLFDITEEESRYLLDQYFSDVNVIISEVDEDEGVGTDTDYVVTDVKETIPEEEEEEEVKQPENIISSIRSLTEDEYQKREKTFKKENIDSDKIDAAKELKKNISDFLKNIGETTSLNEKKITIITFLERKNFKAGSGYVTADIFNIRDEKGLYIFNQETINEWYKIIVDIEDKQKNAFECSQLIISICLYGIEFGAKKLGIEELSDICSEIKDPSQLPSQLLSTKRALSNLIDDNLPNNCVLDFFFFVGNVYLKKKTGFFK